MSIKPKHVVIIPLTHTWDFSSDYQRQVGLYFAKRRSVVIAVEAYKEPVNGRRFILGERTLWYRGEAGIWFVRLFHLLPFERYQLLYRWNRYLSVLLIHLLVRLKFPEAQMWWWFFNPQLEWMTIIKRFFSKARVIYDCMDYFLEDHGKVRQDWVAMEERLVNAADVVVAVSKPLQKHLQRVRKEVWYVPQGFRLEELEQDDEKVADLQRGKPIIGYHGGINDRLDFNLLLQLAQQNPQWDFVFWGPVQTHLMSQAKKKQWKTLLTFHNVRWGEAQKKKGLKGIVSQFEVGIVPYDMTITLNHYCSPEKVLEYWYCRVPVVATPVPELLTYDLPLMSVQQGQDWSMTVKSILSKRSDWDWDGAQNFLRGRSFENRYERIAKLI
jgi:glycosyltransferase involved in cell wall biosynthesis